VNGIVLQTENAIINKSRKFVEVRGYVEEGDRQGLVREDE